MSVSVSVSESMSGREALAWAESVLGARVQEACELPGGLTSTMWALSDSAGGRSVLRLMTEEPWRRHGSELTRRERAAQHELAETPVPAPWSLGLDADATAAPVAAHLMTRLPGQPRDTLDDEALGAMAEMLATIHDVAPSRPFRDYQSWAWEAKWLVPAWTTRPAAWRAAFDLLAQDAPTFTPSFLHRDYSHRNLLWRGGSITGVVDWVETSTGPAWLDAAHAATNLALTHDVGAGVDFLARYGALTGSQPDPYWLVMDAVGFLPPPGRAPMFGSSSQLARLDAWLGWVLQRDGRIVP